MFVKLIQLKMFYDYQSRSSERHGIKGYFDFYHGCIINYYGITQDPETEDFMIIMDYYSSGDLKHYITKNFYRSWYRKLIMLISILNGLKCIFMMQILFTVIFIAEISFVIM